MDEIIIHLYIDGELIETTPEHPFYTDDGVWIDAADLQPGEMILSLDGDYGMVESVVVIEDANQPMYNLTVDEAHTFFVGDGEWLVHNVCKVSFDSSGKFAGVSGDLPGSEGVKLDYVLQPQDMVAISNHYDNVTEFALARELSWSNGGYAPTDNYWLFSGNPGEPEVVVKFFGESDGIDGFQNMYHTHPSGDPRPSGADNIDITARNTQFGQERSGIIPIGVNPVQVHWYDRNTPWR